MQKSIVSVIIIFIAGLILFSLTKLGSNSPNPTTISQGSEVLGTNAVSSKDLIAGKKDSKVIFVEYSDFQCPACAYYDPILNQVIKEYGDRVAFVYRHYPLPQHKNAESAAQAAQAASNQNKFWEYKNILFENQKNWETQLDPMNIFISYASSLQLDLGKFRSDYYSAEVKNKIALDKLNGDKANLDGTPSFFLNGNKISNPKEIEQFRKVLDAKLETSSK